MRAALGVFQLLIEADDIDSDSSIKMFVQHLEKDQKIHRGVPFILQDLGDTGLFVKVEAIPEIEAAVADMLDRNHFASEEAKN